MREYRRMRRTRAIWQGIVQQHKKSGQTHNAFATERGLPVATLRSWIYRLRREEQEGAPILPVRVVASTAPQARQACEEGVAGTVEVELPDGVRVRFSSQVPARVIGEVVAALRDRC